MSDYDDDDRDEDVGDIESGPFCPHWSDPGDCPTCWEKCAACGHTWKDHERDYDGRDPIALGCEECDECKLFVDPPETPTPAAPAKG